MSSRGSSRPLGAASSARETPNVGQAGGSTPEGPPPARPGNLAHWSSIIDPSEVPDPTRFWELFMPAGMDLLTANQRLHWAAKSRVTKDLRWTAYLLAKQTRIPALKRARIWCVYQPPGTRGIRDVANLAPTAKAQVDGLVDAHILADDSDQYLVGPDMRRGATHAQGRLVLLIAELPPLTQETPHA